MADETKNNEVAYEYVEVDQGPDPVAKWLKLGILALAVIALLAVLYALLVGIINPSSPRTASEARLVTLRTAAQTVPDSGKARREYIDALLINGDVRGAKQQLAQARKDIKKLEIAHVDLAELDILWSQKEYAKVVKVADTAYKNETKRREDYYKERKKEKNIQGIEVPKAPLVEMKAYQGRANGALKKWDEAVKSLSQALKDDPLAADLLVMRADAYVRLGQKDKAKKDLEAALEYIPDFAPALAGLESLKKK